MMWSQDIKFRADIYATTPSKLWSWLVDVRSALPVLTENQHQKHPAVVVGPDLELYLRSIYRCAIAKGVQWVNPVTSEYLIPGILVVVVSVEPWYFQHPWKVAKPGPQTINRRSYTYLGTRLGFWSRVGFSPAPIVRLILFVCLLYSHNVLFVLKVGRKIAHWRDFEPGDRD